MSSSVTRAVSSATAAVASTNTATAAPQVVPSSTSSASTTKSGTFPVAAIAVIAIFGGLAFLFVVYRVYRCHSRRRRADEAVLPEARAAAAPALRRRDGSDEKASFGGSRSASALGWSPSAGTIGVAPGMAGFKGSEAGWTPGGSPGPASRSGSDPTDTPSNGSNNSHSSLPSHPGMATAGSRSSMASYSSVPRRFHGPNALGQMSSRPMPGGPRISGAPHHPRTRLEIVPPLPLAPPPGAVISTGKSTLDFAPDAGIGAGLAAEEATRRESEWQRAGGEGYAYPQPHQHHPHHQQQQQANSRASSNHSGSRQREVRPINTKGLANVEAGLGSPLDQLQQNFARQAGHGRQ